MAGNCFFVTASTCGSLFEEALHRSQPKFKPNPVFLNGSLSPILRRRIPCCGEVDQFRFEPAVHLLHRLDLHQALDRPVDHRIQPLDAGQIIVKRI